MGEHEMEQPVKLAPVEPTPPQGRLHAALRDAVLFIENHAPDVHTHEPDEHIGNDCPVCDSRAIVGELRELQRELAEPEPPRCRHCEHTEAEHESVEYRGDKSRSCLTCKTNWAENRCMHFSGAPAPCVWRADWREGRDGSILVPSCQPEMEIDAAFVQECVQLHGWKFCVHCGAPLKVER